MLPRAALAVVLLSTVTCFAQGADDARFEKLLKSMEEAKAERIQELEDRIAKMARSKAGAVPIRKVRAELGKLKNADGFAIQELTPPLRAGAVGALFEGGLVEQVVNEKEALIDLAFTIQGWTVRNNALVPNPTQSRVLAWVKTDTSAMTDDAGTALPGVWVITGSKKYDTVAGGTKTVFVLEPVDTKAFEAWYKARKKK